jgi:PAS domain S-box-containing protein
MDKNGFQESASALPDHSTLRPSAAMPPRPGFSGKWRVSIVLLASLLISFSGWYLARGITIRRAHDRFDFRVKTIETSIRERLQAYEFLLRGAGGLFAAADDVTRQSWKTYVTMMQVDQYYPGIQGVGFAKRVLPSEKETHILRIRSEGFPEYDIRPAGERTEYTSIIFLEPFDWRNRRAFGYDMFSETVRKDAMSRARDTGSAVLSGKVTLVQETDKDVQAGFLMYLPVYQGGKLPESLAQRREALLGYVYSPFRMNDFMRGILSEKHGLVELRIFDGDEPLKEALLFQAETTGKPLSPTDHPHFATRRSILEYAGHHWVLVFNSSAYFEDNIDSGPVNAVLLLGVIVSLLLFFVVSSLARSRNQAISLANMTLGMERVVIELREEVMERRRAEEALRESEEKFRLTFNSSPDAVIITRLRDGLYIDINDGFTQLTGFTHADIAGKAASDIDIWYDPSDREKMIRTLREKGVCINLEARFRKKDGIVTTALLSARVISLEGEPHIMSITRDISERKQAEAERERLMSAIEQASETIVITETDGTIQYVNPAFEKTTGHTCREAVGENPRILKSGFHDRGFYQDLWNTITAGKTWKGRMVNRRKDGSIYTEEASISPVLNESGTIVNYVGVKRDITKEIDLEKRVAHSQRIEAIGALAGGIAHDFNNLLFPIIGMSEMLLEDIPPETFHHEHVEVIYNAARRAGDLVKQILSFSRQSKYQKTPVQIQQILKEALKLSRATIPSDIEIHPDIQNDCGLVMADPTQIHQIAINLITNAYHAVEAAGGAISVSLKEIEPSTDELSGISTEPGKYALLTVSDTGQGIDPSVMNRIFEPYFTTKAQGKGSGLGLSVVYGIIKEHGGDIRVYSDVGKGATFHVYLPLLKDAAKTEDTDTLVIHETGSERILIVDDEESIVRLEQMMLARLGYHVTARTSSVEALAAFKATPGEFDLVMTDMNMPKMTGVQLTLELISIRPDIPVILCTGFSEKISEEKAKAMHIRGFLMKPVVKTEMSKMVRKVLDGAIADSPAEKPR